MGSRGLLALWSAAIQEGRGKGRGNVFSTFHCHIHLPRHFGVVSLLLLAEVINFKSANQHFSKHLNFVFSVLLL